MIIGVCGYAQHGKDSVARVLVEEYGFTRMAFADTLKEMAYALDPIIEINGDFSAYHRLSELVDAMGWDMAKGVAEVRRLLQRLGTEAGRDILGQDVWVNALERKIPWDRDVVVPDVRFSNELEMICENDGILIHVFRPGFDNGLGFGHLSEANVPKLRELADFHIKARTLQELERQTRSIMEQAFVLGGEYARTDATGATGGEEGHDSTSEDQGEEDQAEYVDRTGCHCGCCRTRGRVLPGPGVPGHTYDPKRRAWLADPRVV